MTTIVRVSPTRIVLHVSFSRATRYYIVSQYCSFAGSHGITREAILAKKEKKKKKKYRKRYSPVWQDDDNDPAAGGSAATQAAAAAPRDDDDDDDGDADDVGSRRKPRQSCREEPADAAAADDDEDDAISSPGHPPVLRLSARVPPRQCSRSYPLQSKFGDHHQSSMIPRQSRRSSSFLFSN